MSVKIPTLVITFSTTSDAIAMERFCKTQGVLGELIPIPSEISAGCGMAWKTSPEEQTNLRNQLLQGGIHWASMQVIDL